MLLFWTINEHYHNKFLSVVVNEKLINTSGSESGSTHSDTSNDSKTIRLHITHKQRRSTPDSSKAGRPIPDYGIIQTPVSSVSGTDIFLWITQRKQCLGNKIFLKCTTVWLFWIFCLCEYRLNAKATWMCLFVTNVFRAFLALVYLIWTSSNWNFSHLAATK